MRLPLLMAVLCGCGEDAFDRDGDGFVDCVAIQNRAFRIGDRYDCFMPAEVGVGKVINPQVNDCDDDDASVNPAADEVCDGIDNDCDGLLDGADPDSPEPDCDGDGRPGYEEDPLLLPDCDDNDANRSPDLPETCDGIDNDCDGWIDNVDGCEAGPEPQPCGYAWISGGGGSCSSVGTGSHPLSLAVPICFLLLPHRLRRGRARL
jgi:hypothetical protein